MGSMTESDYAAGHRDAWIGILRTAMRELGHDAPEVARLVLERSEAVQQLRILCGRLERVHKGDNDWPDDLYLPDVIAKHLRYP
jgi:hypothetical protein